MKRVFYQKTHRYSAPTRLRVQTTTDCCPELTWLDRWRISFEENKLIMGDLTSGI